MSAARAPVPRGRHAPPVEVRHQAQQERLLEAGYELVEASDARGIDRMTVEVLSRAAGMSKATFYTHWANVDEFKAALCAHLASEVFVHTVREALARHGVLVSARMADAISEDLRRLGFCATRVGLDGVR